MTRQSPFVHTYLESQLAGLSPPVEDDAAGGAESQGQPHVHRGRGVHRAHDEEDPVDGVGPEEDPGEVGALLPGEVEGAAGGEGGDEVLEGALHTGEEEVEAGHEKDEDDPLPLAQFPLLGLREDDLLTVLLFLYRSQEQFLGVILLLQRLVLKLPVQEVIVEEAEGGYAQHRSDHEVEVVDVPEGSVFLSVMELLRDQRSEEGSEAEEEMHGVHVI